MLGDILVINAGSSSIKISLFGSNNAGPELRLNGQIESIGTHPHALVRTAAKEVLIEERWSAGTGPRNHDEAMRFLVDGLTRRLPNWKPAAVGHRVVHGGGTFRAPTRIDEAVRAELQKLIPLAPLHQPPNLDGIDAAANAFPGVPQIACFDTSFHQGHPWVADTYALPPELHARGIRRYGFHGLSYTYIARAMRRLAPNVAQGRMIVAHLGNGVSMCALREGRSMESTMGFTALDGLPMGTRCGQIDPGVLLYLAGEGGLAAEAMTDLLYKQSGLLGLSGVSGDMRDLLASKEPAAAEAIDYFVYRAAMAVGSLAAALEGLDGLVFTAGIGEHAVVIRERICARLGWLGVQLDPAANEAGGPCISKPSSPVSAWVVPTDEERMIAIYVMELLDGTGVRSDQSLSA